MTDDETRADRHRLAAHAYRLRQRGAGRCVQCGRRRAVWVLIGEGAILHTRELTTCGRCWQRALRATRKQTP